MTPLLWNDMPSADDPSETLEQTLERLCDTVDRHVQRMDHIRAVLREFHLARLSLSSVQKILDLAVEMNPDLGVKTVMAEPDMDIITQDSGHPF